MLHWARLLLRVHKSKKVAFVYLATELIQRSLIFSQQTKQPLSENGFHSSFEKVIYVVLPKLFEILSKTEYMQIKIDILKVLKVWIQRSFFNIDNLQKLKKTLCEIG